MAPGALGTSPEWLAADVIWPPEGGLHPGHGPEAGWPQSVGGLGGGAQDSCACPSRQCVGRGGGEVSRTFHWELPPAVTPPGTEVPCRVLASLRSLVGGRLTAGWNTQPDAQGRGEGEEPLAQALCPPGDPAHA